MGRKSSIKRLDPRVREAVDAAIREGRATIDDIVAIVAAMGGQASRSAVGRYKQQAEAQMQRYREAQEVAKVWIGKLQADPEGDVGRLLAEMLRTTAFQTLGDMEAATPGDVMFLAKALKDLASADKLTAERIIKVRQEMAKDAADKAAAVAKSKGLSKDTVEELRREILGVA
jgi:hypothetical protein